MKNEYLSKFSKEELLKKKESYEFIKEKYIWYNKDKPSHYYKGICSLMNHNEQIYFNCNNEIRDMSKIVPIKKLYCNVKLTFRESKVESYEYIEGMHVYVFKEPTYENLNMGYFFHPLDQESREEYLDEIIQTIENFINQ